MSSNSKCTADIETGVKSLLREIHPTLSLDANAKSLLKKMIQGACNSLLLVCASAGGDIDTDSVRQVISYVLPPDLSRHATAEATAGIMRLVNDLITFQVRDDSDSAMEDSSTRPTKRKRRSVAKTSQIPSAQKQTRRRRKSQQKEEREEVKPKRRKKIIAPTKRRKEREGPKKAPKRRRSTSDEDEAPRRRAAPKKPRTETSKRRRPVSPIRKKKAASKPKKGKPAVVKTASAKQKSLKGLPKEKSGINFVAALKKILPNVHKNITLSNDAADTMNLMLFDIFLRISKSSEIAGGSIATILSTEFPLNISQHAQAMAQRDILKYSLGLLRFKSPMQTRSASTLQRKATEESADTKVLAQKKKTTKRLISKSASPKKPSPKRSPKKSSPKRSPKKSSPKGSPKKSSPKGSPKKSSPKKRKARKPKVSQAGGKLERSPKKKIAKRSKTPTKSPGRKVKKPKTPSSPKSKSRKQGTKKPKAAGPRKPQGKTTSESLQATTSAEQQRVVGPPEMINFAADIPRLLAYFNTSTNISNEAAEYISEFLANICNCLTDRVAEFARSNGLLQLTSTELHRQVSLLLPQTLADHAIVEGARVTMHASIG